MHSHSTFFAILGSLLLCLSACVGAPANVPVVTGFQAEKYLGTWYEIARLDHSFERNMVNVTAHYEQNADGSIKVTNRGFDTKKNEWKQAIGTAKFVETPDIGKLKVSFFGPFYGGYNIVELDKVMYQYALVVGPNKDYLWILSRTPQLTYPIKQHLMARAKELGFATDKLIHVEQSVPVPEYRAGEHVLPKP